jgi:hypothetical protein
MDIASLPQSVDQVGSFRYTTKLSEYLAAGLPVVTGQIPLSYDLPGDWLWRIEGDCPWDARYVRALGQLLQDVSKADVAKRQSQIPGLLPEFDQTRQVSRFAEFVNDVLERTARAK